MIIKKPLILVIVALLCISIVSAIDFTVDIAPINNNINIDEKASFNLSITNNLNTEETFRIYSLAFPEWDIQVDPLLNPIMVTVPAMSTKSIELLLDPLQIRNVGLYTVTINAKMVRTGQIMKMPVEVAIKSTGQMIQGYIPTVIVNIKMPNKIDPREEIPIQLTLSNQNILNISEMTIRIESKNIYTEIKSQIGPKESKTIELKENIDSLTKPQKDALSVTLLIGDRIISGPIVQPIEIIEYADAKETATIKSLLKTERRFLFKTNNDDYGEPIKIETQFLKNIITSTRPKSKFITEDNKRYFSFALTLNANNEMEIRIIENYRPLVFIFFLILIAVLMYFAYRGPLMLRKVTSSVERKEGGISELKIVLNIKNRSKDSLKDIEVIDSIPSITNLEKELFIGTLQPYKVLRHEKKGTILKWKVDDLGVGEERVISYKVKSKLPILGSFSLEAAVAKYNYKGKDSIARSNSLTISA